MTGETLSIDGIGPQNLSVVIEPLEEFHEYEMMVAASTDKGFGPFSTPLDVLTDEHGIYSFHSCPHVCITIDSSTYKLEQRHVVTYDCRDC